MNQTPDTCIIIDLVQAPECIASWIDRFYTEFEQWILLHLKDGLQEPGNLSTALGIERSDLIRAWQRGVIFWDDSNRLFPADFHTRFDHWAMFEGWKDIPDSVRAELNSWELDHYCATHAPDLEVIRSMQLLPGAERIIPRYLLLEESFTVIDQVEHIFLWPCNCRSMLGNCKKPVYTCLRFDNDRGLGWEISPEKAKEIIQEANRAGLMQSGELGLSPTGRLRGAICNCCADCCFPHLMSERFQAGTFWPKTRYRAEIHPELCSACGRCIRRCPFQALELAGKEASSGPVLAEDLCRGCGLCATGCPEQAIVMRKLDLGFGWDLEDLL